MLSRDEQSLGDGDADVADFFNEAYLGLGGNIGDVKPRIFDAWEQLEASPIISVVARSQLYRTSPVGGPAGQDDYVNAACRVRTTASARELLDICLDIEQRFGRERLTRWAPRTLDIDLLLFNDELASSPGLQVPHPRLRARLFALAPLVDIAPPSLKLPPDNALLIDVFHAALTDAGETIEDWRSRVIN